MKRLSKAALYTFGIIVALMSMTYLSHNYPVSTFVLSVLGLFGVMYWVLGK